jgi:hypothetical protein
MTKHILAEHPIVWCRWKITNLSFAMEKQQQEKSKMKSMVGYGAITNHFQSKLLIRKMMHNNKNSKRTCYYLFPKPTCPFPLWKVSGCATWCCVRILELSFQIGSRWFNLPSMHQFLEPWKNM